MVQLGFLSLLTVGAASQAAEKVVLQLRWEPQFQFAGYYAALKNGYYSDAGIDVEIRHAFEGGGPFRNSIREVVEDRAEFGVGALDILIENDQGNPMMIVASFFQESPVRFFTRPGVTINTPADLADLRIIRNPNNRMIDIEMQAFFLLEGIDLDQVTFLTGASNTDLLKSGQADVMVGHQFGQRTIENALGTKPGITRPSSFGINFYGDSLVTRRSFAEENPDLVNRFRLASIRGWEYAVENPEEIIDFLIETYDRKTPLADERTANLDQAGYVRDLSLYPVVALGNINPGRWLTIASSLQRLGIIEKIPEAEDLIFDPEKLALNILEKNKDIAVLVATAVFLALIGGLLWTFALRRTVEVRTTQLQEAQAKLVRANQQLKDSNRDLEEFAYVAAHDLQEPLRKIQSFGRLIEIDQKDRLDEQGKQYFALMIDAAERMRELINDLLSYSRVTSRGEPFERHSLTAIANEVVRDLQIAIEDSGAEVAIDEMPAIDCDRTQISQLLNNLIGNALKFRRPDVVPAIHVTGELTPSASGISGNVCEIRVSDNGIGIEEKHAAQIFEPFKRLHNREKYPGTGIGLTICHKIASRHSGKIAVTSHPGVGSTFIIRLPEEQDRDEETRETES
jgi:signal transduction histidine kinase